ncbi:MAG: glycosyltransferase family 4 protein [Ktedonobacterales bacterium]
MRILWLMTRYWPAVGGAELHSQQIIHALAERGHTIHVVSHWDSNRTDWLRGTTVFAPRTVRNYADGEQARVTRLGYGAARRLRTAVPAITYYLRQTGAAASLARMLETDLLAQCGTGWDIVHGVRVGREPLYVAGQRFARRLGVPFVFTPLHHPRWVGPRYRVYLDLYRQADALIALTDHERALYEALGVCPERIHVSGIGPVLPATADGARFRAHHNIAGPLILFVGQKYPYKGYEDLLTAAQVVWQRRPEVVFAFLGPRTATSRRTFTSINDPRIVELDTVDLQTKGDALDACDILCVPSEQESFGGVYTEAWSYGKAVIGCDIPAVREVIADGTDGIVVPRHSPSALAAQLDRLLGDPAYRSRLGESGRSKVAARYTWEHIAAGVERLYDTTTAAAR